jgi:hypothetical protein
MADAREFFENWVHDNVQSTAYRNKAEARRLAYECRKATDKAGIDWSQVIKASGCDVEGYIQSELNRAADQEAEHI